MVRLDEEDRARVDAYQESLDNIAPRASLAEICRYLLKRGLDAVELERNKKQRREIK